MSQNINERVPSPLPAQAISIGRSGDQTTSMGKSGIIFNDISRITGTYNSDPMYNPTARGVRLTLVIDPTGPATGAWATTIEVPDPVDSTVWKPFMGTLTAATGFSGNGTGALTGAILTMYPGLTGLADTGPAASPTTINQHLGPVWRVKVITTLDTLSFSVGGDYLM